jgi:type III restriction enzyme
LKFKFDPNQQFQLDAINAVVDIFEGQPLNQGDFEIRFREQMNIFGQSMVQMDLGFGNNLIQNDDALNANLKTIQKQNNIHQQDSIKTKGRNFVVEMETGTGKTYVYLRTIFELNKKFGFKKFIVVVPSVAIREGVLKSIDIMKEHFLELYNNASFTHFVYNSKRVNQLRNFATGNDLQIMIINIDSFNKKENNIIHDERDQMGGRKPIEFIQTTNPIVIMDEPQNMETERAKEAIASLNPICTLRYSATHRDKYNLVYLLDPVKAFQKKLVKKISVASVLAESDPTQSYLKVEDISNKGGRFTTKLKFFKQGKEGPKLTTGTFRQNDDLFLKSGENEIYRHGFRIIEINARPGMEFIRFANGIRLFLGDEQGGLREEIVKKQIRETIKAHFEKELQVHDMGIKVLSLFFLDRVENYRVYKENSYELGRYAQWFEEIYDDLAKEYRNLFTKILPVEQVHNGYFSKDRHGQCKDTHGNTIADTDTYSLIMKDKEELLSLDNPLKFIFSHSALREGWDNPNVFQICTLNETTSAIKKRQEIGRGLRLPVNQNGERVFDEYVNNLVVVANESYQEFVEKLQREFEDDCGIVFGRLPIEAFIGLKYTEDYEEKTIDTKKSEVIWEYLKNSGWIADDGFILETFGQAIDNHTFSVPESVKAITREIIEKIEEHQIEQHVSRHNPVKGMINEKVLLDPDFEKFWKAINTKTVYSVNYSTDELIEKVSEAIMKMDKIEPPKLRSSLVDIDVETKGITATQIRTPETTHSTPHKWVPDILSYIQSKVELTRSTIFEILKQSERLKEFPVNPQRFMDVVVKEIRNVLHHMIIKGIQYEKLDEISYEMSKFREDEHKLEFAKDRIVKTKKSVYDYITYDSGVEKKFAKDLETMKNIKYFIKLPSWFKVPTPVGSYNPDWAILKQNGEIVYMIRETKSTKEKLKLRLPESDKISCGFKHFETIGIDYKVSTSIDDAQL